MARQICPGFKNKGVKQKVSELSWTVPILKGYDLTVVPYLINNNNNSSSSSNNNNNNIALVYLVNTLSNSSRL